MEATNLFSAQELASATAVEAPSSSGVVAVRRVILGVDPGASGAIAFYRPDRPADIEVYDTPLIDGQVDAAALGRLVRAAGATEAMVERVGAMPKQGVSSTFKFGMAYGAVLAACGVLMLPLRQETPGRWKKHFRLDADKEKARALAIRTWPSSPDFSRKKDHGRAEAALIALFAAEVTR
jgi:crossover junction endodeoxyribonuclease RuvC